MGDYCSEISGFSTSPSELHTAAKVGDITSLDTLLSNKDGAKGVNGYGVNGDLGKSQIEIDAIHNEDHKRTALMIASVEGHYDVVEKLIEAGADLDKTDSTGLNARELAALEGNLRIASKLREAQIEQGSLNEAVTVENGFYSPQIRAASSYAQGPLKEKSLIVVKPGSGDVRKGFRVVKLGPRQTKNTTIFNGYLHIKMTSEEDGSDYQTQDLRVEDNCSVQPVVFYASDPAEVKLIFDVAHDLPADCNKRPDGARAVALLSNQTESYTTHMSLHRDITVPLISDTDREVVGSLTFNILVVRPFKHEMIPKIEKQTFPPQGRVNRDSKAMVVGHRGLGKNMEAKDFLQLGENTIESFNTAARLGAEYVEFDVQVTKDRVPVIYHDFLVGEAGVDVPIHEVTTEQLINLGNKHINSPQSLPKVAEKRSSSRPRSMSSGFLVGENNSIATNMRDREARMANTFAMKARGFKANTPGRHIVFPFTNLEEMFHKIDKNTGFNIEVKYPMLDESEGHGNAAWNSWELNLFVDTILNKVFDLCHSQSDGKTRNLYFSSFNADVCLLLKLKQDRFPVMFLTNADGRHDGAISDPRASSLSQAIAHCENWGLDGVVSEATPLIVSPRLVRYIRDRGMRCLSYGTINNDVDNVRRQVAEGIDAVIVDRVGRVVKAMKEMNAEVRIHGNGFSNS